jgi:hypothetical protein
MKIRISSVLVLSALVLPCFVGCGDEEPAAEPAPAATAGQAPAGPPSAAGAGSTPVLPANR